MPPMKWFVATLILESRVGTAWDDEPLLDHQVHVIRAPDPEAAYQRALALGSEEETEYANPAGETVKWRFAGLGNLEELLAEELVDGTEVYSWRSRGLGANAARAKEDLSAFADLRDQHRTARQILDEQELSHRVMLQAGCGLTSACCCRRGGVLAVGVRFGAARRSRSAIR